MLTWNVTCAFLQEKGWPREFRSYKWGRSTPVSDLKVDLVLFAIEVKCSDWSLRWSDLTCGMALVVIRRTILGTLNGWNMGSRPSYPRVCLGMEKRFDTELTLEWVCFKLTAVTWRLEGLIMLEWPEEAHEDKQASDHCKRQPCHMILRTIWYQTSQVIR